MRGQGGAGVAKESQGTAFAKTTRPTIGSAVPREALFARLDEPAGRTVVWISGRPGSGKTTLAAGYVQTRRLTSVWYQVDADDADPAAFFHYLTHAVRKLGAARTRRLPSFTPQCVRDVAAFARTFFRELFANMAEPMALVLDNLQALPPGSALSGALEAGFSQVPKGSCVIVTSRSGPPASLARLRAGGQMSSIAGEDLNLTADEIVAMARVRGQLVSPESAATLHQRTEGWAAGLVLLLEHTKLSGRIADLPPDRTPQVVFDYLGGEIFDRFDHGTREFLMRIACLPRMTAAVAAALGNEPRAERLLVNFAQNDYFVRESASATGRVYQLHPLFRAFLRKRAAETLPEAGGRASLQRAAGLLREAEHTEDAVTLLVEAADWEAIADIVVEEADGMLAQGRLETLEAWIDLLPAQLVDTNPRLLLASAQARAGASRRVARQLFERAFDAFQARSDAAQALRCCCAIVDASVDELDDLAPLDRWLEILDGLLSEADDSAAVLTATPTLVRATLIRDAAHPRIDACLQRTERVLAGVDATGREPRDALVIVRALTAFARADLTSAESALGTLIASPGLPDGAALSAAVVQGLSCLVSGAHAEASRIARQALTDWTSQGIDAAPVALQAIVIAAGLAGGTRSESGAALKELESASARLGRGERACVHYLLGWLAALDGDETNALREAKLALALAIEAGMPWFECLARIALAQRLSAGEDQRNAGAQLRAAESIAQRLSSPWLSYAARLAASSAALASGDKASALEGIRIAFREGYERGFRAPPGWQPHALAELCATALDANVEPEFGRALVREGRLVPAAPPLRVRRWPWSLRIVSCGGFECLRDDKPIELSAKGPGRPMELLKVLVALGMHNVRADQIADALWPNVEADYAYKSFTATLHRLRRMVEDDDALVLRDGRLSLNKRLVWVDTWALDALLDDFDTALRGADACFDEALRREYFERAAALYRGPFLPDESEQPSYIARREQLRARVLRFISRIARGWEEAGMPAAAADCLLRFVEVDELSEPLYRQLMLCYQRSGAPVEAVAVYERLRTILSARQKLMPSPETQALYATLKAAGSAAA
jgi:ATP/maltotriose-dependent transcriptional regulator MalT/DNA-binding SARP family transcriptional activator